VQNFAKGLLDVADNLGRAAAAVPEEFRKSDGSGEEPSGAAKILISLLLGVEMTEKQLIQVYALQPFTTWRIFFPQTFSLV
jgi:molecular chaperone GrpE